MVFVDLHISEYVVYETGESRGSLGTDDTNASYEEAVHSTLDEAEDMLHAASNLGFLAVILLLLVCQRMVTIPFLADDGYHATLHDHIVLGFIANIEIQRLSVVLFLNERTYDIGVVDTGICGYILLNEFGLLVCLGMELIAIVHLAALLGPACIGILMALLVWLVIP